MMSRLRSKIALLLTLLATLLSSTSLALEEEVESLGVDPSWNYLDNGKDWDFASCNDKSLAQAPYALDTKTAGAMFSWTQFGKVAWLTAWEAATINSGDYGVTNYTFRINATDGNMGSVYLTEPFAGEVQILWEV